MAEIISLPYLDALKGKYVKVFKGGPESREGRLLEVNGEYIVIQTEENQLVYYSVAHLKVVVGNAKKTQTDYLPLLDDSHVYPETFSGLLETLNSSFVQVNGGGPASKVGQIIDIKPEYLVLSTEKDGLVLFPLAHIKSVALVEDAFHSSWREFPTDGYDTLSEILSQMIYLWGSISAGGPEKVEGVLMEVAENHIVVVNNDQILYIPTDQIHFIGIFFQRQNDSGEKGGSFNKNKNKSNESSSSESSSFESSSSESSSFESSSSESSSFESSSSESSSSESSSSESSSFESSSSESSSFESSSSESSSCGCRSHRSSSCESSSSESSSSESSSSESSSCGCKSHRSSSCESSSHESSDRCKTSRRRHRKSQSRPRVNTFKKIWLENLIKASKTSL